MLTPAGKNECGFQAYTSIHTYCVLAETVLKHYKTNNINSKYVRVSSITTYHSSRATIFGVGGRKRAGASVMYAGAGRRSIRGTAEASRPAAADPPSRATTDRDPNVCKY